MPTHLIETIPDLIATIDTLPNEARAERLRDLETAMTLRQEMREVALGLLALDLVTMDLTP